MSPFHARTARAISTNSGKVLITSMTPPIWPLDPEVPQTLKPKRVTREKTLCNIKYPDGWRKLIKFFPGSTGPGWIGFQYIKDCLYLWPSYTCEPTNQSPPNFVQTSTSKRFLTQVWPRQSDPLTPGYPKLQNLNRSLEKKTLFYKKCIKFFPGIVNKEWIFIMLQVSFILFPTFSDFK